MRHSSWEDDSSDNGDSLNDCRVKNMEEFRDDAGNGTYGQRIRKPSSKSEKIALKITEKQLEKELKKIYKKD